MTTQLFGGIEAGGTKFICGVGSGNGELLYRIEIPTLSPAETFEEITKFFNSLPRVQAIGVGSFGPLDLNKHSATYGTIQHTTKNGWSGINIPNEISTRLGVPVAIETDTDVAAIGEYYHGRALGVSNFLYLTVGTGIGGSIMESGKLLHGISHPEMGHMIIPPAPADYEKGGACSFHKYCLEGFASGKSIQILTGKPAEENDDHALWDKTAYYIALGLLNITYTSRPGLIILGGSVIHHTNLVYTIKQQLNSIDNDYIQMPKDISSYVVKVSSDTIGVLGAIKLATLA